MGNENHISKLKTKHKKKHTKIYSTSEDLDRVQRAMFRALLRHRKFEEETWTTFHDRVRIAVDCAMRNTKTWSSIWRTRGCAWHLHICRHPLSHEYQILRYRDSEWMRKRRQDFCISTGASAVWTMFAGRTDTRSHAGIVFPRWEESWQDLLNSATT